jgi:hypothetical protein
MGATLVGALFGRKLASAGNVGRAASTMRGASRAARERADVGRAEARVEEYQAELAELERDFERALADAEDRFGDLAAEVALEPLRIAARKSDIEVERLCLAWVPIRVGPDGRRETLAALE